jgi:hypothetical protein
MVPIAKNPTMTMVSHFLKDFIRSPPKRDLKSINEYTHGVL